MTGAHPPTSPRPPHAAAEAVARRVPAWFAGVLLAVAIGLAYSNSLQNAFVLDDLSGIVNNPYVRSLRFVPRYFVDPLTLTVNQSNAEYRPLLSLSFALNYQVSGYATWSWHVVNLVLHWVVCVGVFVVGRLLFGTGRVREVAWLDARLGDAAALLAAVLFAVHPVTTGVANYAWSRSSLLVAAFLIPATGLVLRSVRTRGGPASMVVPAVLYSLALLSKPEAIGFVAVAGLAGVLLDREGRRWRERVAGLDLWLWLAPLAIAGAVYLGVRTSVMPPGQAGRWANPGDTPLTYLLTQTRAWWYYIGQALAPLRQIADHTTYPRVTDLRDGAQMYPVALAIAGWLVVVPLVVAAARRAPGVALLVLAYFVYLAPSSSLVPLAEMVNEHRPYLPLAGLFLVAGAGAMAGAQRLTRAPLAWSAGCAAVLAVPLVLLTRERNLVWRDDLAFWADIAAKEPAGARAQMNHGIALMSRARFAEARDAFERAARAAPAWNLPEINLGIATSRMGDAARARAHFDRGAALGPNDPQSYSYRGEFRQGQGDLAGAIEDFRAAADRASVPLRELVLLSGALLDAGRLDEAERSIVRGESLDRAALEAARQRLDAARRAIR